MTKEALKLALEALESCDAAHITDGGRQWYDEKLVDKAITAIKESLAQPEQEPVAWRYRWSVEGGHWVWNYATYIERQKDDRCEPLYTTPPQRTWVGLTDEDCDEVERWVEFKEEGSGRVPNPKLIRYIEAKLKEKNNG